CQQYNSLFNF
nr:immunoglobulin light chain junction region [Macaca mulatta]